MSSKEETPEWVEHLQEHDDSEEDYLYGTDYWRLYHAEHRANEGLRQQLSKSEQKLNWWRLQVCLLPVTYPLAGMLIRFCLASFGGRENE